MKSISVTRLRREIFSVLDDVGRGEMVEVTRNGVPVASINPLNRFDWREKVEIVPYLLMAPDEAFAPLEEEWEPYT